MTVKRKKILFINPPAYTTIEFMFHSYNSSIYRLATYYKNLGHDVEVLNLRPEIHQHYNKGVSFNKDHFYFNGIKMHETVNRRACGNWDNEHYSKSIIRVGLPISELVSKIVSKQYDEIMISVMFTYLWEGAYEVINNCRMFSPESKIILGGIYPTLCSDHAKTLGADELHTERICGVDLLPKVNLDFWDEIPIAIDVMTGYGCYNSCTYCAVHVLEGRKHLKREPLEVVDEIEAALSKGVQCIRFLDSNILWDFENHFEVIIDELLRRGLRAEYTTYGGMDTSLLSVDKLAKMVDVGLKDIEVPVETISAKLQQRWNRTLSGKAWLKRVNRVKELNIPLRSFVLGGCVGQTTEDIQITLDFVEDAGVKAYLLFFTPIPGTLEWFNCKKEIGNKTLEELNPLLFPMANENMTVKDLQKLSLKYSGYTMNYITKHPDTCKVENLSSFV